MPPRAPRCSVDVPLRGIRRATEALSGERRRKPHNLIRGGPCASGTPAALWMFPCAEYAARQKLCLANAGENRRIQFEVGLAPSSTPAALWMFPCAEYAARQKLCPAHAGENRRIKFEVALPPRAPPLLCGCSPARNTPRGRRNARPGANGSGADAAYFIRRGTAAGTRAGCSSPPRTAKGRRRERACPCRSR